MGIFGGKDNAPEPKKRKQGRPGTSVVEMDDGDWVEILDSVPFGVHRQIQRVISPLLANGPVNDEDRGKALGVNLAMTTEIKNVQLIGCIVDWSIDDPIPVTQATINELDREWLAPVIAKMNSLYYTRTSEEQDNLKKGQPSPSSTATPSPSS